MEWNGMDEDAGTAPVVLLEPARVLMKTIRLSDAAGIHAHSLLSWSGFTSAGFRLSVADGHYGASSSCKRRVCAWPNLPEGDRRRASHPVRSTGPGDVVVKGRAR